MNKIMSLKINNIMSVSKSPILIQGFVQELVGFKSIIIQYLASISRGQIEVNSSPVERLNLTRSDEFSLILNFGMKGSSFPLMLTKITPDYVKYWRSWKS
uniref:Uncharacterized protein n=1 Tax=Cacopsylla melanoneura TaxID=428564 RepID=A0A8D8Z918_9HEMI